jgi:hypothetical protein
MFLESPRKREYAVPVPLLAARDCAIAVVGDGFGSVIVYATAVYLGFRPEEITIYGPSDNPVKTYQQFAFNLGQTVLRSESESHFLPADWPTFAELEAWSRKRPASLYRSARRRYNPGVPDMLAEVNVVAQRLGWNDQRYPEKVGWLQRGGLDGDTPHFVLFDEQARFIGRAKHVMLSCGHGPLSYPPALAKARRDPVMADRIVQAYAPKQYDASGRYIVVGSGIASVNEWANALDAGAKCIALLRNPMPDEQDLNTPRCFFEALGIDAFQSLDFDARIEFLSRILKGTSPHRRGWDAKIAQGRSEGRFEQLLGEIDEVKPGPLGLRVHVSSAHGDDPGWLDVTGVVAGTGFNKSALSIPLLRRLIEFYKVPIEGGRMKLQSNCGVPGLDRPDSRCAVMGIHANPVVTHGDTIAGLKYIGRRFVADCFAAEKPRRRSFPSRLALQLSLANETARVIRRVRREEQLA